MKNKLEVRNKKIIYFNNNPLVYHAFDVVLEFKGYLIAYDSDLIVFIHPNGHVVSSMTANIIVVQVFNYGEYISLKASTPLYDAMGVFHYDGEIVVPFQYDYIFISDKGIEVRSNNEQFTFYKRWET